MKHLLLAVCIATLPALLSAQTAPQDLSTARTSPDRKAILDALRPRLAQEAGVPVSFVVDHLKVQRGWAYFHGATKRADGGDVAWGRSFAYADMVKQGMFDGDGTSALFKKVSGHWKYVTHLIGPTDVGWSCWWKEYGAPRAIFDIAEDCAWQPPPGSKK